MPVATRTFCASQDKQDPKERLLAAAEELFAHDGIRQVAFTTLPQGLAWPTNSLSNIISATASG